MTIYLYTKQHSVTGLKYFGMTRQRNPYKYIGSGLHWMRHIAKHGKEYIQTTHLWGFDNQEMCTEFALTFSKNNDIVESKEWANLQEENGLGGAAKGRSCSDETRKKMSIAQKGQTCSEETRKKISNANRGKTRTTEQITRIKESRSKQIRPKHTEETKQKMRESHIGAKRPNSHSKEANLKKSIRQTGKRYPLEFGIKISNAKKSIIPKQTHCPHCDKSGSLTTMHRWHFNNCKKIITL